MAQDSPAPLPAQRRWTAACPNCGAPVAFRSAASAFAVCGYCRSQVLREGEALRRVGESAELFDDHTPLTLGATGRWRGAAFTLVGRVQLRYAAGTWNEWHALFEGADGDDASPPRSAWLSEDNGRYVMSLPAPTPDGVPPVESLAAGRALTLGGERWEVASVQAVRANATEGELPSPPVVGRGYVVVDLRNGRGEVATIDYGDAAAPGWSVGQSVALDDLAMTGLVHASEKTLATRGFACPSCGQAVTLQLEGTRTVTCGSCAAVIDVSQGIGADLQHYAQSTGAEPQIPLGSVGELAVGDIGPTAPATGRPRSRDDLVASRAGPPARSATTLPWQVVGYQERVTVPEAGDDDQSFWREYLLYHRTAGFAFLVDAEDGWSLVQPITGVPAQAGRHVKLDGVTYQQRYTYASRVTHVLGEFYWQIRRGERTRHADYAGSGANARLKLNREQTGAGLAQEVTWSAGRTVDAETVRTAFRLPPEQAAALRRDAAPNAATKATLGPQLVFWAVVVVVFVLMSRCDGDDRCADERAAFGENSDEYRQCVARGGAAPRTGGGSYGGGSWGGGHK